jgi:hypothetical protein
MKITAEGDVLIRDKELNVKVSVFCKECPTYQCYWPRPDPGVFTQGQGYRARAGGSKGYLCGTREIRGCPVEPVVKQKEGVG